MAGHTATTLRKLQRDVQHHVLVTNSHSLQQVTRHVVGTARVSADQRLSIYAEGYRLRLIEALGAEFETLKAVAGDAVFDRLCRSFIAAHPSRTPNLRWYGGQLADHLATTPPFSRRPVFAEIARFEWAIGLCFDAADDAVLGFDALAAVPPAHWPGLRFTLHASVQRLELAWNAPDLFQARDSTPALKPKRARRAAPWCIWRRDLTPRFRRLPDDEAWALDAVARGVPFAGICEGLARWVGDDTAALRAATLLRTWVNEQMVSAVQVDQTDDSDS